MKFVKNALAVLVLVVTVAAVAKEQPLKFRDDPPPICDPQDPQCPK